MERQIQVLQILGGARNLNGIASYIYQQYKFIDKKKVRYDFFFTRENSLESVKDDPIFKSSNMYVLGAVAGKTKSNDYISIIINLRKYLKKKRYDVVVVNSSVIELGMACWIATLGLVKNAFIVHAHNAGLFIKDGAKRKKFKIIAEIVDGVSKVIIRKTATYLFGCSKDAGAVTFGKKVLNQNNFFVIRNAIDIEKFTPKQSIREAIRIRAGVEESTLVVGNVGSLIPLKNYEFLIKVFYELHKQVEDSALWIVGDGPEKLNLERMAQELSLSENVVFWGARTDVNEIMQGMDAFVFTSKSEGLGIVAIEAQAAGLYTTISDGVPDDVLITKIIQKLPLAQGSEIWAEKIINQLGNDKRKRDVSDDIRKAGYDIKIATANMTDFYIRHFANRN